MKKLLYISVLFLFGMTSCIQDYLDDGGTHSAESNTTPYEYLSSHTYHMFDTLIQIIDHYGLEEEMNRAATVFACSDFSVKALLKKRSDPLEADSICTSVYLIGMISPPAAKPINVFLR